MMKLARLAAIVAAGLLACAPAAAQRLANLPAAGAPSSTDTVLAQQPSLCIAGNCSAVLMTLGQIQAYVYQTAVPAAAKLATARTINGVAFDGTANIVVTATDSTPRVPTALTISTSGPLAGGGALTGNLSLSIGAASGSAAGTMSAADKSKLDGIAAGATANTGTVTSVSATGANGIGVTVTNAGTTPSIAITGSALTPTTVAATGTVTGSNLSGTNTGDQTSVTGNAGTATKLATARTIAGSGDTTWTISFDGSGNVTGTTTISANAVTFAKIVAATQPALIGATAAGTFGELTPASGRTLLGVSATGADPAYAKLSGAAFTGTISAPALSIAGDATFARNATTGYVFFGTSGSAYLGYSGGGYQLNGAGLSLGGSLTASGGAIFGGDINAYRPGATTTGLVSFGSGGNYFIFYDGTLFRVNAAFAPQGDNSVTLGTAALRWSTIYANAGVYTGSVAAGTLQAKAASTVSALPTCNAAAQGTRTTVTDAAMPLFLNTLSGGGSVIAPAFCNGSAWIAG